MSCTNRLGAEYGEDRGPCGDEGRVCEACFDAEAKQWAAYFGLRDDDTREERREKLARFRPVTDDDLREAWAIKHGVTHE